MDILRKQARLLFYRDKGLRLFWNRLRKTLVELIGNCPKQEKKVTSLFCYGQNSISGRSLMKRRCLNRKERFSVVSSFQRAIRLLCGFGDKKRPPTAVIGGRKGRLRQGRHISIYGFVAIFDLS